MAVYLGSERVGVAVYKKSNEKAKIKSGKVTSDENGVVTFPKLNFTPNMIVVWNVRVRDLSGDYEENYGEPLPEDYVRYIHEGVMLFAINQDGIWVSQGMIGNSGETNISNASWNGGTGELKPQGYSSSGISINDGIYSYQLSRYGDQVDDSIIDTEFNYAIYG